MKNLLEKAIRIAVNAHMGQLDKGGHPYILHPLRVMMEGETPEEMILGILHDTIEDTSIAINFLQSEGFPHDILKDLELLTKKKDEDYFEYLAKIKNSPRAKKIKLRDMKDNSNILRLHVVEEKHLKMIKKYHSAVLYLTTGDWTFKP